MLVLRTSGFGAEGARATHDVQYSATPASSINRIEIHFFLCNQMIIKTIYISHIG